MHDALYAARGHLEDPDLVDHARGLGLDAERVAAELESGAHGRAWSATRTPPRARDQLDAGLLRQRRCTPTAYDAGSLVAALKSSA